MVIGLPLGLGIAVISAVTLESLVAWPRLCTPSLLLHPTSLFSLTFYCAQHKEKMDRPPDLPCYPRTEKPEEGGGMGCRRDPVSEKADSWDHVVEGRTDRFLQAETRVPHSPHTPRK